jgi:hypothetical protein
MTLNVCSFKLLNDLEMLHVFYYRTILNGSHCTCRRIHSHNTSNTSTINFKCTNLLMKIKWVNLTHLEQVSLSSTWCLETQENEDHNHLHTQCNYHRSMEKRNHGGTWISVSVHVAHTEIRFKLQYSTMLILLQSLFIYSNAYRPNAQPTKMCCCFKNYCT